jgi:hypothetical protein
LFDYSANGSTKKVALPDTSPPQKDNEPGSTGSIGIRITGNVVSGFMTMGGGDKNTIQIVFHSKKSELLGSFEAALTRDASVAIRALEKIAALLNRTNGKAPASDQTSSAL